MCFQYHQLTPIRSFLFLFLLILVYVIKQVDGTGDAIVNLDDETHQMTVIADQAGTVHYQMID